MAGTSAYELRGVERVKVLGINIGVGRPHKLTKYNTSFQLVKVGSLNADICQYLSGGPSNDRRTPQDTISSNILGTKKVPAAINHYMNPGKANTSLFNMNF